jgi:hypothetical protein
MQDLRIEMGILTDQVAVLAGLKRSDLAILDVVAHDGPMSPTQVARRTGVHPATLTGVLVRAKEGRRRAAMVPVADLFRKAPPTGVSLPRPAYVLLAELGPEADPSR